MIVNLDAIFDLFAVALYAKKTLTTTDRSMHILLGTDAKRNVFHATIAVAYTPMLIIYNDTRRNDTPG